jgi:signal transduction histidine kinase
LTQVVLILLDNALKFTPSGGTVDLRLAGAARAAGGSGVLMRVTDSGPGVPPEERELIFERFKRGRDTAGQAGFGLGLAIGRELAERMGGELELDASFGPGARFTLTLPVARATDSGPVAVA